MRYGTMVRMQQSTTTARRVKIALFRSLFRGREDVYPRRFENQISGQRVRVTLRPVGMSGCARSARSIKFELEEYLSMDSMDTCKNSKSSFPIH